MKRINVFLKKSKQKNIYWTLNYVLKELLFSPLKLQVRIWGFELTWTFFGQDPTVSRNSLEVWLLSHQEDHIAVLLAVDQRRRTERREDSLDNSFWFGNVAIWDTRGKVNTLYVVNWMINNTINSSYSSIYYITDISNCAD